jgi:lipopolysaccharide/colanic/teichoic acid biosynthesis glycosyltransferase
VLVLGEKYKFTDLELDSLYKKFPSINIIRYKNKKPQNVIEEIEEVLSKDRFTVIVLNTKALVDDEIIKYLTNLKFNPNNKNINLVSMEDFLEKYLFKCYIPDNRNNLHCLNNNIKGYTFFQKIQKKIIDTIAIFFIFLIFPIIKIIVNTKTKKESPGNIYFKQLRVGLDNKKFECIKFRTMHIHNTESDIRTATKDDDRIFSWGKTMRKTRIDELPQVFNILKGDIHLIGPRAEWDKLTQEYEKEIPYYNLRHMVKPGITGWAQVMFVEGRSKEDTKQKLMYDLYYIKHWSILLEIKVIYKTIAVVLSKKGI